MRHILSLKFIHKIFGKKKGLNHYSLSLSASYNLIFSYTKLGILVEVAGVEPASPELLVGLLRAQPVIDLGSPPLTGGTAMTPARVKVSRPALRRDRTVSHSR